jgi:hypothetical protein
MTDDELFNALDLDGDGVLGREELYRVACCLGWHWHQARIYALLDFMTIHTPLSREIFIACMDRIKRDPDGVFGSVLELSPHRVEVCHACGSGELREKHSETGSTFSGYGRDAGRIGNRLNDVLGEQVAGEYADVLAQLNVSRHMVRLDETALLIIDPQRSFTAGEWMWSIGPAGVLEVMPIQEALVNCASLLTAIYHRLEVMFTRCPFPPQSYGWDDGLETVIDPGQHYFIKPGNNVLLPRSNGFREWVQALIASGRKKLVMGGCTLNSCLRVSSQETRNNFLNEGLEVVVDLSLCGARASNYVKSPAFNGMSAVEAAIREMIASGIVMAEQVEWI